MGAKYRSKLSSQQAQTAREVSPRQFVAYFFVYSEAGFEDETAEYANRRGCDILVDIETRLSSVSVAGVIDR